MEYALSSAQELLRPARRAFRPALQVLRVRRRTSALIEERRRRAARPEPVAVAPALPARVPPGTCTLEARPLLTRVGVERAVELLQVVEAALASASAQTPLAIRARRGRSSDRIEVALTRFDVVASATRAD